MNVAPMQQPFSIPAPDAHETLLAAWRCALVARMQHLLSDSTHLNTPASETLRDPAPVHPYRKPHPHLQ